MAFRDDREALRAQIQKLELELKRALERAEELEDDAEERDQLAGRVKELEKKLGLERAKEEREKRREEQREAAEEARKERERARKGGSSGASKLKEHLPRILVAVGVFLFVSAIVISATGGWTRLIMDTSGAPTIGLIDLDRTPSPVPVSTELSGGWSAEGFESCRGNVPRQAQLVLRTHRPMALSITTHNLTPGDAVMVVHTANGEWLCDDDSGEGNNPSILAVTGPGDHRVYVGPYQDGASFSVNIEVTARPVDALPDETGLATRATPTLGRVSLEAGETRRIPTQLAGLQAAGEVEENCRGYLPLAPTAVLIAEADHLYRITTDTNGTDPVLLTRDARGIVRCDDDSGQGNSPAITGRFPPGPVGIWVGPYNREQESETILVLHDVPARGPVAANGLIPGAPPTFGGQSIAANQEVFLNGTSGGEVSAQQVSRACYGELPLAPSHALTVNGQLDVTLEAISVVGGVPSQLVLAARHPDGSYLCAHGDQPLRGSWAPGVHQVWVGTRTRGGQSYQLRVRAAPPSVMPWRE